MRAAIIRTGIMSILLFAASVGVALAGTSQKSQFDSHGWHSDHHGHHSDHNGHHSNYNGQGHLPSQVPITDGLPFLAIAGTAYGAYALTKYRTRSKDK